VARPRPRLSTRITRATGLTKSRGLRHALTFWRRSLLARVVASTVVLSVVVVGAVGWFLLRQTRDGLLDHRVEVVLAEAADEVAETRERLDAASFTETDAARQQRDLAETVIQRGLTRGYGVVLAGASGDDRLLEDGGSVRTSGLASSSVPADLEERFEAVGVPTAWTYTRIRTTTRAGGTDGDPATVSTPADRIVDGPGIVVASQVRLPADGRTYTLYFVFPLDEEAETLGLVTRGLATAAVLLVLLVAAVAWLVTRQVVVPIREARRVAERLAAGRLTERLEVSGEDDLARLGVSFNQMAVSLQRQIRQLEELSTVQQQFVSDVSHELRTPLTTVRMAGDVLHEARGGFDAATARSTELLQAELDRFETLLADLLEISRFDAGAAHLELEDVNLGDLARRVVDSTRPLAQRRGLRVEVEPSVGPHLAQADVRRVERILRNLVTNAIDHADPDGPDPAVVVRVGSDDEGAAVAVRDYGAGLAPGESAQVFHRFWRADPARARTSGGTGLGLAIALEDAHLHGGWLQAWGRLGQGAQFRLSLPRTAGAPLRRSALPLHPVDTTEVATAAAATSDGVVVDTGGRR